MRQQGCPQCEKFTGGDCGQHGPLLIALGPMQDNVLDWKDVEIARLRDELEKAQQNTCHRNHNGIDDFIQRLGLEQDILPSGNTYGQDVALIAFTIKNLRQKHDKALAQVAVLLRVAIHGAYRNHPVARPDLCEDCKNAQAAVNSPHTEARALLDRLRRAEAVVEAARRVVSETCPDISPSMGAIEKLTKALAAWEVGKEESSHEN